MGFIIDSPNLAARIDRIFDTTIPERAYLVQLQPNGDLVWINQWVRADTEPGTSLFRRFVVWLASRLPIEWLL